ncbi:MAG: NTP transferase domain-containing protein [Phycisphaerales bacterium]|nr:NTP transferase domain-containing protein [Phycisphaerales bacterium]
MTNDQTSRPRPAAVILAAGKGTRMGSDLPKVLHEVCGRPMVHWVVDAVRQVDSGPIMMVVGHGADQVQASFEGDDEDLRFIMQEPQLGTGHAVLVCREAFGDFQGDAFVLAGDGPLIRAETLKTLIDHHVATEALATLATSVIDDPTGYGRIVRDERDRFAAIVEHRNATDEQRAIREVYPSYACFNVPDLLRRLSELETDAESGEYYLTSIPGEIQAEVDRVEVVTAVPAEDVLSINTPEQLALVDRVLKQRLDDNAEVMS